jgi:hypothetical protein
MAQSVAIGESGASQAALAAILTLTEQMLQNAREEDWITVADQEARRRQLLAAVFAAPEAFDALALKAMIRQVLDFDRDIMALVEAGRRALGGQIELLQQGQRATAAYQNVAG